MNTTIKFALCLLATICSAQSDSCMKPCTLIYDPVCAYNNAGVFRTFGNKCSFEITQCSESNLDWNIVAHAECKQEILKEDDKSHQFIGCALKDCENLEYDPVCVKDRLNHTRMMDNECKFFNEACVNLNAGLEIVDKMECIIGGGPEDYSIEPSKPVLCARRCPLTIAPVCGLDKNGEMKTFENQCMFEIAQCSQVHLKWQLHKMMSCENLIQAVAKPHNLLCAKACPMIYAPVCGMDKNGNMKTFSNKCMFENTQCSQVHLSWELHQEMPCEKLQEQVTLQPHNLLCAKYCPMINAPVCGMDKNGNMKTFSNKCMFENTQCSQVHLSWELHQEIPCEKLQEQVTLQPHNLLCAKYCPMIYAPVCGMDKNGNMKTFSNKCMFENTQCSQVHLSWEIHQNMPCEKVQEQSTLKPHNLLCAKACPMIYAPVCGMDKNGNMKTFSNKCMFENTQCSQVHLSWELHQEMPCENKLALTAANSHPNRLCAKRCPLTYSPVCGKDKDGNMKTFENQCLFENTQCSQVHASWNMAKMGECRNSVELSAHNRLCAKRCPLTVAPVCGKDKDGNSKVFLNKCLFENTQCSQVHLSWNVAEMEHCVHMPTLSLNRLCARQCPKEYQPVCGKDKTGMLKTFYNHCFFENTQCSKVSMSWEVLSMGPCEN